MVENGNVSPTPLLQTAVSKAYSNPEIQTWQLILKFMFIFNGLSLQ